MSRYIRPKVTGARIFFTVCLAEPGTDLLLREVAALRRAVAQTKAERPFGIAAWVVLPDHMHCVWEMPAGDRDYGTRWGAIKARFTREVKGAVGSNPTLPRSASKIAKGDAGIWQRRFWEHHIRDEQGLAAHVEYCHLNPVKHGLAARPEDWAFSSIHRR